MEGTATGRERVLPFEVADLQDLIEKVGYIGLFLIVFAESGLFFGFFLPGDSLLLTAGLLASRDILSIYALAPVLFVGAVLGDSVGYWFGARTGPRIFNRPNSLFFRRENLVAAHRFFERHGGKAIVIARFLPFIRTFTPIAAGAAVMEYRRFLVFNVSGAFLWAVGVTLLGYGLGRAFGRVEGVDRYFTLIVLGVIFVSGLPTLIHLWRQHGRDVIAFVRSRGRRRAETPAAEVEP
jgi:membrane-associated protein